MKTCTQLPIIGIPMGDPAGIGPEIIVKALIEPDVHKICQPLVFGDSGLIARTCTALNIDLSINTLTDIAQSRPGFGHINVIAGQAEPLQGLSPGKVSATGGKYSYDCIVKATKAAMNSEVAALATTPINKESIKAANIAFIGHTEMLAALTETADPLTMFQVKNLRVFFFSRHLSLHKACEIIKKDKLVQCLQQCDQALRQLQVNNRGIAVAGLNPHCGEHGLFGDEEGREIEPAIAEAQGLGINVVGPVSADSVFHQALQGKYAAVLSLYHDQGHIATKTYDFERTISVTLGLPFIRTSVDHGTAFDIAGKGIASPISMIEAIKLAAEYSLLYRQNHP